MKEWITGMAIRWVCNQLRNDEEWWISYKANIAMSFYDEASEYPGMVVKDKRFHYYCNTAAERFLKLWTHQEDK